MASNSSEKVIDKVVKVMKNGVQIIYARFKDGSHVVYSPDTMNYETTKKWLKEKFSYAKNSVKSNLNTVKKAVRDRLPKPTTDKQDGRTV